MDISPEIKCISYFEIKQKTKNKSFHVKEDDGIGYSTEGRRLHGHSQAIKCFIFLGGAMKSYGRK